MNSFRFKAILAGITASLVLVGALLAPNFVNAANGRDATQNSILYNGAYSKAEWLSKVDNGDGYHTSANIKQIYYQENRGITQANFMSANTVDGVVYKDGRVEVNGKTVATNSFSIGRDYMPGATRSGSVWETPNSTSFLSNSIQAYVDMEGGTFHYAVIKSCGNALRATPVPKPVPVVTPKPTPKPIVTPKPTPKPVVTPKPTPKPVVTPKPTPKPVVTPKPTPVPVVTPKPTPAPVVTPKPTPVPVVTPTPTATPTPVSTPKPTPSQSPSPTPSPVVSPSPTPAPEESFTCLKLTPSQPDVKNQPGTFRFSVDSKIENVTLTGYRYTILQEGTSTAADVRDTDATHNYSDFTLGAGTWNVSAQVKTSAGISAVNSACSTKVVVTQAVTPVTPTPVAPAPGQVLGATLPATGPEGLLGGAAGLTAIGYATRGYFRSRKNLLEALRGNRRS
jgi:hypothetical protein